MARARKHELVRGPMPTDPRFTDITGERFSRLTVIGLAGRQGRHYVWQCRCDCGTDTVVMGSALRTGGTSSCGCYRSETTIKKFTTHNDTGSVLHKTWAGMIQRCTNPKNKKFRIYGERGIVVSEEFRSYLAFKAYVDEHLGPRPLGATLDRINNEGHYERGNIRWLDKRGQGRNRRTNRLVSLCGTEMPLKAACEVFGAPYKVVHARVNRYGWGLADAFVTPVGGKRPPPPAQIAGHSNPNAIGESNVANR